MRVAVRYVFVMLAGALSACGGGPKQPRLMPVDTCFVAPPAPLTLTYPTSNAASVPSGNFQLLVTSQAGSLSTPGNDYRPPVLTSSSGVSVTGGAWTAANTSNEWGSPIPALSRATTYTVSVTDSTGCYTYKIGTFTTL